MRIKSGLLSWNIKAISKALKISPEEVKQYFTDGRRISFILERRLAREVLMGKLAPSEGASFDLTDAKGGMWEVRSISRQGIYFCPSYMVGSGRCFEEQGFLNKLNSIEGYIVSDIESFPSVPFWIIPYTVVLNWWQQGQLGINSKISRAKALSLIKTIT